MKYKEDKNNEIIISIKNLYKNFKLALLNEAAKGWLFVDSFERDFMEKRESHSNIKKINSKKIDLAYTKLQYKEPLIGPRETINYLNNLNNIKIKFNHLKMLIKSNNLNLISDSFRNDICIDIVSAQDKVFNPKKINIIIIGSGATGLFLASTIKYKLGSIVNILVLDNRTYKKNILKMFNRDWLTYIPSPTVQKFTPPNIRELFECFGVNNKIGLPINILESILMLSCKEQGVNFFFSSELDYSKLNNKHISLFFDGTGGRLMESQYISSAKTEFNLELENRNMNFKYAGINQLHNMTYSDSKNIKVLLKGSNSRHYPFINDLSIQMYMIKLTGIPKKLIRTVLNFVEKDNVSNLFYVWEGSLKDEINEGLIFINLTNNEYKLMILHIDNLMSLEDCLNKNSEIIDQLNIKIVSFLEMLITIDNDKLVKIEKPFSYCPYFNMNAELGYINNKNIFPIGDSLFCGHPKMGNGLSVHLEFINKLVEEITTTIS